MQAHPYHKKGYAFRPGWHVMLQPEAPHLSMKNRIWVEVQIEDYTYFDRPVSQGGRWALANRMQIIKEL